jgi:transcriptional regulator with GAF, ATPase, and Fis domain
VPASAKETELRFVGESEAMRALEADIAHAARSDAKVLVTGETGVGKEVAARLIHQWSARSSSSMVTLNCAGLPDSLLESELFGHTRGSFTGAYRDKPGLLEMAPNGTVFLDEVGEMSPRMQAVLLRFLETGEIQRIGADRSHARVNVRLITATNRDLEREVAAGAFREDLFFRLNVIRLSIPPLRERRGDVALLVKHFLAWFGPLHRMPAAEVAPDALEALVAYRWPGNVRELKNVVERIVLKAPARLVTLADLPVELMNRGGAAMATSAAPEAQPRPSFAEELAATMLGGGESFWTTVYPLFQARDLTRHDLRRIIQIGLEQAKGNYRLVVELFNMPASDYKRFLSFLRKHDCHLPFQHFRSAHATLDRRTRLQPTGEREH